MNNETLSRMADYLDSEGDENGDFDMRLLDTCVLGRACHYFLNQDPANVLHSRIASLSSTVFGVENGTREWRFLFNGSWGYPDCGNSDKKAAAMRLRYVVAHGEAPSEDQWPSFNTFPRPVVEAVEVEENLVEEPIAV